MPGSSSTSFIPKHTPNKGERKNSPRQLFIGTLLVRILFFATLISAAGLFFYVSKLESELNETVGLFKSVASTYNAEQADVEMVTDLDKRLHQANERFRNSISLNALVLAIQEATLSTVQITDLQVSRVNDQSLEMQASIITDNFDSVIFQRGLMAQSDELKSVKVNDVSIQYDNVISEETNFEPGETKVTFDAVIEIDPGSIRSLIVTDGMLPPPVINRQTLSTEGGATTTETETSVGVELSNPENI